MSSEGIVSKQKQLRSYPSQIYLQSQPLLQCLQLRGSPSSANLGGSGFKNIDDTCNMASKFSSQQGDSEITGTVACSQPFRYQKSSLFPSYDDPQYSTEEKDATAFQSGDDLQSVVEFHMCNSQSRRLSYENTAPSNISFRQLQDPFYEEKIARYRQSIVSFQECQNCKVDYDTSSPPQSQRSDSCIQPEKHPPACSGGVFYWPRRKTNSTVPSKTRIRWTQDLHDKFLQCVDILGGAEKATPKGILKLMDVERLTIFHIKSHLQKYRTTKCMPDSKEGAGQSYEPVQLNSSVLELKTGKQIVEALQMQLDIQMRLHEQLEVWFLIMTLNLFSHLFRFIWTSFMNITCCS
ncbi:hypothetical protein CDL15_Pgr027223 [Punica granatum]|uniref:HTH myb-type domain-containing protein n=1 Tax=Punica granatum TaxID=22663 RepID=A0A218WDP7_PUNGR|nr:hypothetical protein CDL15_Pgr027223 [Punica granatum]